MGEHRHLNLRQEIPQTSTMKVVLMVCLLGLVAIASGYPEERDPEERRFAGEERQQLGWGQERDPEPGWGQERDPEPGWGQERGHEERGYFVQAMMNKRTKGKK